MRSGNPVLNSDTFDAVPAGERMTINGTINKTAMMLALVMITAIYTWGRFTATKDPASIMPLVWTGAIGGFVVCAPHRIQAGVGRPSRRLSTRCSQGLLVGGLSAVFECRSIPASSCRPLFLTFGTMAVPAVRVPVRAHSGHRELQARRDRGHRRHRAAVPHQLGA